jgi:pimeloyl-ACP methyl ester carboxylesterase
MSGSAAVEEVEATNGDVRLAGSVWMPGRGSPIGLIMMVPGSGPADRSNDSLFAPIRDHFLGLGLAVASFDKRGVGGSSGTWLEADIAAQAADLLAGRSAVARVLGDPPTGFFGHSQGGWVVLEAAREAEVDFVVTNSGPGVTPRVQETYSTANRLAGTDLGEPDRARALRVFEALMDRLAAGTPFGAARAWMAGAEVAPSIDALEDVGAFVPTDESLWRFAESIIGYDPAVVLPHLRVPLLALLGESDDVVPVAASAAVFRREVDPRLLDLRIVAGADHRFQRAGGAEFVPDYLPALTEFLVACAGVTEPRRGD